MKKKVLFALIALFSFLSTWAATASLNDVATGLRNNVPENVYVIGDALPQVPSGSSIVFLDINEAPVTTGITTVGWYFAKITEGEVVTIIPFQAWKPVNYEFINNETTFNASAAEGSGNALDLYYTEWIGKQEAGSAAEAAWIAERNSFKVAALGTADKTVNGVGFPFVVFKSTEAVPCRVAFVTPNEAPYASDVPAEDGIRVIYPWASFHAGTNTGNTSHTPIFFSTTDKTYGVASIPEEYFDHEGQIYWDAAHNEYVDEFSALNPAFDMSKLSVFFTPAKADAPVWYDWYLSPTSSQYTSENQYSDLVNQYVRVFAGTSSSPDPLQTEEYTVKVYNSAACATEVTEVKNVGSYFVKVFVGEGNNMRQIGASVLGQGIKEFKITAYTLTLGSSVAYKQLGDPDPAPEYSLLYDNAMSTEAANLVINGLKLVRQVDPVLQRVPTIADDKVGSQWKYYIDMNEAYIEGVGDFAEAAANYRIGTSSVDGILVITKKLVNDEQFTVTVADEDLVYDGLEKKPTVTITYNNAAAGIENKDVTDQFDITYSNNINADAEGTNSGTEAAPVYAWINGENATTNAKVTVHPKTNSDYTESIMLAGVEQTGSISDKPFKIKQRDINDANVADIDPVIFNNQEQEPTPAVTYDNGTTDGLTLVKNTDFIYAYDNNQYVSEQAEVIVEATYTDVVVGEGQAAVGVRKYTGNWFNKKEDNFFTINKFKFTLKPVDKTKAYGDQDPTMEVEAIPAAEMKVGDTALPMPTTTPNNDVTDIAEWTSVTRATGEFVAVYDITITGAKLKASTPAVASDPANNYDMTVEKGAFEIINAPYFVSSKFVTREFKSGSMVVPDNGFYLYRRVVPTEGEPYYEEIPATDDLYQEIVASGRISGNELAQNYTQLQPVGSPFNIQPIVANEGYDYEIGILDPDFYQHVNGDYAQTPEGQLVVTKRKIAIVADDKTTAFGAEYAELTYKVYAGTEANADKILDGTKDVDGDGENDNFTINTNNQYAANTIVQFGGLASNIAELVNAADKPLTAPVPADIVAQNQQTTINANPNYDITFVKGTYTVTPSGKTVFVNLAVTKNYGEGHVAVTDAEKRVVTVKLGATPETAEDYEWLGIAQNLDYRFIQGELLQDEPTEVGTYGKDENFKVVNATETPLPTVINGYPVDYDGSLTINKAGAVTIAVKTLVYNYPVEPQLSFDANRVKVTGAATFAQIAANNPVLTYEKPQVGFIKKGAEIKVQCGEKAYGTPAGEVVDPETAGADWAWVKNYESVTVKSSALKVTCDDEITLDIVAFNQNRYVAEADVTDQLVRDYAGTEVSKVNIKASYQDINAPVDNSDETVDHYTVKGNQWYSMVLPFKSSPRDIQKIFNGFASVDILSKSATGITKASEIRFALTVDSIPANEPFVTKTDLDFGFQPVTINAAEGKKILIEYPENEDGTPGALAVADARGNQFIGTYMAFFAPDKDNYDMINLGAGKVQAMKQNAYVRPLGAYIKVAEGVDNAHAPVRVIFEEADGTLTTIDGVEVEDAESAAEFAEGWYTVTGVKLTAEPTVSGTYIYNGKKVFFQAK